MIPEILECLLALRTARAGGGILWMARWQFLIPFFPPATTLTFRLGPPFGAAVAIKYAFTFGSDMMQGAIWADASQGGRQDVVGYICSDWLEPTSQSSFYVVFSDDAPMEVQLTNDTNTVQQFQATQYNIFIPTYEDYTKVMDFVRKYSMITQIGLARDANALLEQLVRATGQIPKESEPCL